MSFNSTRFPMRGLMANETQVYGIWAGGGAAANCTLVAGRGIASVAYNAATGAYLITFTDVGATLLYVHVGMGTAGTTAAQNVANVDITSYSASAKTIKFFVTDVATPTAQDLLTTEHAIIQACWADSGQP